MEWNMIIVRSCRYGDYVSQFYYMLEKEALILTWFFSVFYLCAASVVVIVDQATPN